MRQLVARSGIDHVCSFMYLILLLVDYEAFVGKDGSNVILLLLTTNEKDLVLCLNRRKILRKQIGVSQRNLYGCLRIQLVDEKRFLLIAVVVKTRFDRRQDIIRFEANNIVEEAAELIGL